MDVRRVGCVSQPRAAARVHEIIRLFTRGNTIARDQCAVQCGLRVGPVVVRRVEHVRRGGANADVCAGGELRGS